MADKTIKESIKDLFFAFHDSFEKSVDIVNDIAKKTSSSFEKSVDIVSDIAKESSNPTKLSETFDTDDLEQIAKSTIDIAKKSAKTTIDITDKVGKYIYKDIFHDGAIQILNTWVSGAKKWVPPHNSFEAIPVSDSENKVNKVELKPLEITLEVSKPISKNLKKVHIQPHDISIINEIQRKSNTFNVWLVSKEDNANNRVTLYLKFNKAPESLKDFDVVAEVSEDEWQKLKDQSYPWFAYLDPDKLIMIE
jgi:hypothetical protein